MAFFKNFIVVFVLMGICSRVVLFFYSKKIKKNIAIYFTFFTVNIFVIPIVSLTIGLDIAVSEYVVSLIIWLLFDLMRLSAKKI